MILSRARVQILFLWLTQNPAIEEQKRARQVPAAILPKSRKAFRRVSAAIITKSPFSSPILFDFWHRDPMEKSQVSNFEIYWHSSNFWVRLQLLRFAKKNCGYCAVGRSLVRLIDPGHPGTNRLIRRNLLDGAIAFDKLKSEGICDVVVFRLHRRAGWCVSFKRFTILRRKLQMKNSLHATLPIRHRPKEGWSLFYDTLISSLIANSNLPYIIFVRDFFQRVFHLSRAHVYRLTLVCRQ